MKVQSHKSILVVMVTLCLAAAVWAQQPEQSDAPQTAVIIGTVYDANGDALSGANVVLQGPTPDEQLVAVSLEGGIFKFDGVQPGVHYHIQVSADGFADWISDDLVFEPGQFYILSGINLRTSAVQVT